MSEKTKSTHTVMALSPWRGLLVLGLCLLGASLAIAQLTTGTITGAVNDPSGAAVPGAAVTVKNVDTGISRALVTGPNGRYEAPNLPVGKYEVSVALPGFQTTVRMGIELTVGRTAVVDLVLQVGQVTQNVTVTGEAPLVDTTSATVAHLVDEKRVGELPLNNRDLTQLTFLQPGVLKIPSSGDQGVFSGMGDKLTVAGSRGTQNLYLLDGVSNSDLSGNAQGASGAYIGAETVKEFQIVTNNYSADYRSAAGAIVSAVTKSGTNALHGSAFEFLRNDNFDAAKWEDNAAGQPKPEFKRNQFGGSLGGPIRKDRTFFFGSYEGLRERLGSTDFARVPSVLARTGVLPTKPVPVTVASVVKPYLDLFPVPGQGNTIVQDFKDGTVRIAGPRRRPTNDNFAAGRLDHQFSGGKKGFLSGTYNYDKADRSPFGILSDVSGSVGGIASKRHVVSVRHTSVLSTSSVNEFNFGYSFTEAQGDIPLSKRDFSKLAFRTNRRLVGQLNVGELSAMGYRVDLSSYTQKSFSFKDGLSLARGKHSLRMGAEISRFHYDQFSCSRGCNGIYDFQTLESFLTNVPNQFQVMLPGGDNPGRNLNQILFGAYFQDNYAVLPSLTLNLGLRYEFTTVPNEENDKISNLVNFFDGNVAVPASIVPQFPDQKFAGTIDRFYTNATLKSFSPRFGFAWAPGSKKTSVRGGFGIFYEFPMLYNIRTALQELPPFVLVGRLRDRDLPRGTAVRFPDAFFTQLPLLRGRPNIRTMEFHQRDAYIYRWSLTIQRELRNNWLVSAGYTGSRALHLWQQVLPNINRWQGWPNQPTGPKFWPAGATAINPNWGEMRLQNANGNSYYQGLAVGAQKRLTHGFQFQAAYTFSKAIDNGSGVTSTGDELPQSQRGIYAWDMGLKRGLSSFDIRNAFTANFSFEPPFGKNLTGVAGALGKGWQWNGILSLASGYPLSVFDTNQTQRSRIGDEEDLRADLIPGGRQNPVSGTTAGCGVGTAADPARVPAGQKLGGPNLYYDPCQFAPSREGFFGTLGRNTVISPGLVTFDLSVFKSFGVRENSRFQFRAEFFNFFNRANFGTPDMNAFTTTGLRNRSAGQITSTRTTSRQIQFGLKYIF